MQTIVYDYPPESGQVERRSGKRRRSFRRAPVFVFAIALSILPTAHAGFIGDYAPVNFQLTNNDANGFASFTNGGLSLVLTGGNTGSGLSGTTDLTITATGTGLVVFDYFYSSLDYPGFDSAGYLLNDTFIQLASVNGICGMTLCPATVQFAVTTGGEFGWRVATADNTGEPGVLTITSFSAPTGAAGVPEPGTMPVLVSLGGAGLVAGEWRRRRNGRAAA